jgi:hypothetical protein
MMSESLRSWRFIALFAAYIVALQALLLPLSIATGAPFASSLCASAASRGGGAPASDQSDCPCAAGCGMQCCAPSMFGAPPQIVIALGTEHPIALSPAHYNAPVQKPANQGPQLPRPPPTA